MAARIPQVEAWAHPDGIHWIVWCPYCRRHHWHGAAPGYREPHCGDGKRWQNGYVLVGRGPASAERVRLATKEKARVTHPGLI